MAIADILERVDFLRGPGVKLNILYALETAEADLNEARAELKTLDTNATDEATWYEQERVVRHARTFVELLAYLSGLCDKLERYEAGKP